MTANQPTLDWNAHCPERTSILVVAPFDAGGVTLSVWTADRDTDTRRAER